jgi:PAS domain S-box-containing protein
LIKVLLCIAMKHDWALVSVAAVVCAAASWASFYLYAKTPVTPLWRRRAWVAITGLVAGLGIWTTHFVAMLAFNTGLPTGYAVAPTLESLVIAIVGATLGFATANFGVAGPRRTQAALVGGLIVGVGITSMHFVGMLGYRPEGRLEWDGAYIAVSAVIGAAFGGLALLVGRPGSGHARQLGASALLVAGIAGTHFTGMTALTIIPDPRQAVPIDALSNGAMAATAVGMTALILITSLVGVALDTASRYGSLRRVREALDAMSDCIAMFGPDGRLVACNAEYAALCATRGTKVAIGVHFDDLMSRGLEVGAYPDAIGREAKWLIECKALHAAQVGSHVQRTSDGRWLQITERRTADGGVVTSCVDITKLKQAESKLAASEERFRRLATNAPAMLSESRLDGEITYVSPASLTMTGFTPEELIGRTFASLMEPEDAERIQAMCRTVFASKGQIAPWMVEFRAHHKSGAAIWLECKPTLAVDPETGRFLGLTDVITDITAQKALEAELRAARAEAESAAAVKAEFLANMSHELRTPLTSIIGFTALAAEQPELSEITRTYVARVRGASQALLSTVNDVLDFSKLEAGQVSFDPRPVGLSQLCRATLDLFTPQAAAKDIRLDLQDEGSGDGLVIAIDPDRIRQILLNLVSNAVKFTVRGGVTLRTSYDHGAQVLGIDVIDTGVGVADDKLALLFQRFSQIDGSLTRAHSGTGLGLAICKGLVEAMGGQIGVESGPGVGSRFWFRVPAPLASGAVGAAEGQVAGQPPLDGVRVLVVDDHPTNRELARLFLAGAGADIVEACDGQEAVELARDWPFDVILMDLHMPRLDGADALRRIRGAPGPNDTTPIVAFTADTGAELTNRLLAEGFDEVVAKPLDAQALLGALSRAMSCDTPPSRACAHAE